MSRNRLWDYKSKGQVAVAEEASVPEGFVLCPAMLLQGPWQLALYQAAYEQAVRSQRPTLFDRACQMVWN